jgi:hypothetical protein
MISKYLIPAAIAVGVVRKCVVLSGACYESSNYDCDLKEVITTKTPLLVTDKAAIIAIGGVASVLYFPYYLLKDLRGFEMDLRGMSRDKDFMCKRPVDVFGFLFA